jgi:hypothetical protein
MVVKAIHSIKRSTLTSMTTMRSPVIKLKIITLEAILANNSTERNSDSQILLGNFNLNISHRLMID